MLEHELETAVRLAREASVSILKFYREGVATEQKIGVDSFSEPVTAADREASRIIVTGLAAEFPGDGILSEEEDDEIEIRASRPRAWIIDPIDGTAGFINHDGDFAVQIGLADKGDAVLGVVLMPFHDVLIYAVRSQGTFLVHAGGEPTRLTVSDTAELAQVKLAVSRNHPSKRMQRIIEHFRFKKTIRRGSVGLKVGLITDKRADLYIHPSPRTKLWDTCGPQVILEEAGGRMTDLFGAEIRYDRRELANHNGIVASNGQLHDVVIDELTPLLNEFGRVPYVYS
jgi:3'(2'), 5'-bisphosphate nucleotidase